MNRKILHIDLDAFFCAVEEILNPFLKNKIFATGGSPEGRGVVTSASYAARKKNIHSAMPMAIALRKVPDLIVVKGHFEEYEKRSDEVIAILNQITPAVEQISIDEAFLDVSDLKSDLERIALDIQMRIYSDLNLPVSIGGASNKLVAKISTNIAKSSHTGKDYPMAIKIIPQGEEKDFLDPLPVVEMWGIGPKSSEALKKIGIETIGDILRFPKELIYQHFGKFSEELIRRALGVDVRPVGNFRDIKSVSNERTFYSDTRDEKILLLHLKDLSEKVAERLRNKELVGKTIRLKIRWKGFETHTRQMTLDQPTNNDSIIFRTVKELFFSVWEKDKLVRLVGVGVSNLDQTIQQLSLFNQRFNQEEHLLDAIDSINKKFGKRTISKGFGIKR